ncbi:MAG: TIGR03960 family B12-binding radical SAM protein [Sedimentisphaerales bacterium]|nr:TIGR03960 family B12-binding radical SAM protein [Sedimentisphaerales bacterium]
MDQTLASQVSRILLPRVEQPGQYLGGEINQIRKDHRPGDVTVALAFPDTYAIGMSHLGLQILYEILNRMDGVIAERVFCPWVDAAAVMRQEGLELFSWETRRPVGRFDILGITLQHELSYSNVLYLLDLAGITFRAAERADDEPLVIGGGPLADSCEPVADFFDLVVLGDGEEALPALVQAYRRLLTSSATRRERLIELAREFSCVYVPQLYRCSYHADGTLQSCEPLVDGIPAKISRAQVADLDAAVFPIAPIVPFTESVHDRIAIEIMRGCPQRCAFCHAGHTRGAVRTRSIETILEIARRSYAATGHDTVSLLSLSTSDYPDLAELVRRVYGEFAGRHVGISLPSLRVDRQLRDVPGQVSGVRREGLTVAVEAARDPLRRAIGKHLTDDDLLATMEAAYRAGWQRVKLYFMVGLPGEAAEDIDAIADLSFRISRLRRQTGGQDASVNVTVSWLVPKPHTPLAWCAMQSAEYFSAARERLLQLRRDRQVRRVNFKFHHLERSLLEGVLARGDRRLGGALETAYRRGARFDSWDECFRYAHYLEAFEACGLDPDFYARRQRDEREILPWAHLGGDNAAGLYRRWQRLRREMQGQDL